MRIAEDPTKELELLGWKFTFYGAEGKYFEKGKFGLQVVEQSEISPSIYNTNYKIDGTQNLHIWQTGSQKNLFYGYCHTIEDFKMIEKLLGITK